MYDICITTEGGKKMSAIISVRVSDAEQELLNKAASVYGCGVSSLMKRLVFEKLEDEYDLHMIEDYENKKKTGTLKTRPASELWAELDL